MKNGLNKTAVAIHVRTKEQWDSVTKILDKKWVSKNPYDTYGSDSCIYPDNTHYSDLIHARYIGSEILSYEEFLEYMSLTNTFRPKQIITETHSSGQALPPVYYEIAEELKRAREKHPNYPEDLFRRLAILSEEVGEVTMAVNDYDDGLDTLPHIREELIQTAAMCVRFLESLGPKLEM